MDNKIHLIKDNIKEDLTDLQILELFVVYVEHMMKDMRFR